MIKRIKISYLDKDEIYTMEPISGYQIPEYWIRDGILSFYYKDENKILIDKNIPYSSFRDFEVYEIIKNKT